MASMLTGAYPKTTGLRLTQRVIPESLVVMPEIFGDAGYRTGAVVAHMNVGRNLGFDQGFQTFVQSWEQNAPPGGFENEPEPLTRFTNAGLVNDQALAWLRQVPEDDRYFLWLHYIDPHGPYVPPDEYRAYFQGDHPVDLRPDVRIPGYQLQESHLSGTWIRDLGFYRAQYDREIRYLDDEIGRLMRELEALGRDRETLIVLTADHGESGPTADHLEGVVLLLVDNLRADRLSISGHDRPTTPAVDALARRGVLFEQAVTGAPWTLPAMISLVTGRHPSAAVYGPDRLRTSAVETMREAGVHAAAFTEGGFFSSHFGFDRGFEDHHELATKVKLLAGDQPIDPTTTPGIEATFGAAEAWLRKRREGPFFLLVHTYEPHTPYRRQTFTAGLPSGALGRTLEQSDSNRIHLGEIALGERELAYVSALYDGGVNASDVAVGRLLDLLRQLGIEDRVAVVLTSDHGEDLGGRFPRRAAEHGHSLYDELLRVPLVIANPMEAYPVKRVASQVRLLDVMPTVMDLLSLPPIPDADGRSLPPLMRGKESGGRVAFARATRKGPQRASVREGGWKLIAEISEHGLTSVELYELANDPAEHDHLAASEPERRERMEGLLRAHLAELRSEGVLDFSVVHGEIPDPLRDQLRALGYIE
jgi:arylsulfatase A-like enzyme